MTPSADSVIHVFNRDVASALDPELSVLRYKMVRRIEESRPGQPGREHELVVLALLLCRLIDELGNLLDLIARIVKLILRQGIALFSHIRMCAIHCVGVTREGLLQCFSNL
jgi:hypothetical protein